MERLGKYRILGLLATGGMGEVFLARQEGPAGFSKQVVVKRLLRHLASDQNFTDMFINEARLAASLTHSNIVQIFELGEEDGSWFIAMEYVHGRSLRAIAQRAKQLGRRVPWALAAEVLAEALHGLHYAHTLADERGRPLGIVHRDVTPENVLVSFSGLVKLVDFGIAKATNAATTLTGTVKGKFEFMAPEQLVRGQPSDARTDLYQVGVVLYELLCGQLPFAAGADLIGRIIERSPRRPSELEPDVPPELEAIALRAIEKDPARRFASAQDMSAALERFVAAQDRPVSRGDISRYVTELFADELKDGADGAPVGAVRGTAVLSADSTVELEPVAPLGEVDPEPTPERDPISRTVIVDPGAAMETLDEELTPDRTRLLTALERPRPEADLWRKWVLPLGLGFTVAVVGGVLIVAKASQSRGSLVSAELDAKPGDRGARAGALADAGVRVAGRGALASPGGAEGAERTGTSAQREESLVPEKPGGAQPVEHVSALVPDAGEVAEASGTFPTLEVGTADPSKSTRRAKKGRVDLRVHPWAEVVFDGKSLGVTPMPAVEVPPGAQVFTLRNKQLGVTRKVSVVVPSGGEVTVKVDLFQKRRSF